MGPAFALHWFSLTRGGQPDLVWADGSCSRLQLSFSFYWRWWYGGMLGCAVHTRAWAEQVVWLTEA